MRCPRNWYRLVRDYLSNRTVVYRTATMNLERHYDRGAPQDSNSGPFLSNLIANSLLELDLWEFVKIIAYADDFTLLIEAPIAYQCRRKASAALERIATWAELQKLTFSAEKTVMVYFRKKCRLGSYRWNPSTAPRILFLGRAIKALLASRYLGVMVDDKLNVMTHCAYIKQSLENYVRAIHSLSRRNWGPRGDVLKRLYKEGIERLATYG